MKILILSCSTGGGHDAAAKALCEKFKELKEECVMIDSNALTSKRISNKINNLYIDIVTHKPNLFKKVYRMGELYGNLKIKSPIYGLNYFFAKNLNEFIEKNKFDIVITTHLFPTETLTIIKKKNPNLHFIAVATDYVCIPFWEETNPDYFVIPHKDLKISFVKKGIDENKLLPFGIPVSPKFEIKYKKSDARLQLGLSRTKKIILIMTGSMGFGDTTSIIENIINKYDKIQIVVICGNNKELKQKIKNKFNSESVIVKGFTENINIYMDASDLILTKPGGLTSTETAVKNIPTIFTDPIPGCENYNAEFFKEKNMAFVSNSNEDTLKYLDIILNDKSQVRKMKTSQSKNINKTSATMIAKFVIKNYKR